MSAPTLLKLLDGSVLEGGGQLLRNSASLACLLGKPIAIEKIRNGRKPPGLRAQHTAGIMLVGEMTGAQTTGVSVKSCDLSLHPGAIIPGDYMADPGTAGSTTLLLQVSLPVLLFASSSKASSLTLHGGTNATMAPPIDYTQRLFLPFIRKHFGCSVNLDVNVRGYFPRGGGRVTVTVPPMLAGSVLRAVNLTERGPVARIFGECHVAGHPAKVAERMCSSAVDALKASGFTDEKLSISYSRVPSEFAFGQGGGVILWAETEGGCVIGGTSVGAKSLDPEKMGKEAAASLLSNLAHEGACVDEYMQDQIILFMALADGVSVVRTGPLTLHTKTAIWIAETLTDAKFEVEELSNGEARVTCTGIGHTLA